MGGAAIEGKAGPPGGEGLPWVVLIGPGPRLGCLERLLRAFLDAGGTAGAPGVRAIGDLAELLSGPGGAGRVVLDGDHVPSEDIGMVRRFLADNPPWVGTVVGDDAGRTATRALLGLPRMQWLAWPPDVDQLGDLLVPQHPLAATRGAADPAEAPAAGKVELATRVSELADITQRLQLSFTALGESGQLPEGDMEPCGRDLERLMRFTRGLREPDPPAVEPEAAPAPEPPLEREAFDLGEMLEEKLASLAVRGRQTPRYHYAGDGASLPVHAEHRAVSRALDAFLEAASACAGPGEVVRVHPGPRATVHGPCIDVLISFPEGPLAGLGGSEILQPGALGERLPEAGLCDLARQAEVLRSQGGAVGAQPDGAGRLRLALRLPRALD